MYMGTPTGHLPRGVWRQGERIDFRGSQIVLDAYLMLT
jgi:hypothetical protein